MTTLTLGTRRRLCCGQDLDAFFGDPTPQIAASASTHAKAEWLRAEMDAQLAAETFANLVGKMGGSRFCGLRTGGRYHHRQVDVAAGTCLAASHAAKQVRLPDTRYDHGQAPAQEAL